MSYTSPTGPDSDPSLATSGAHPVQVFIPLQEQYSRGLAVLGCLLLYGRYIALIPVLIVLYILLVVTFFVAWFMQFAVLFTGRYPAGAHSFVVGVLRLTTRTQAWAYGLVDRYPGFKLSQ
jgi:hypothetical protein